MHLLLGVLPICRGSFVRCDVSYFLLVMVESSGNHDAGLLCECVVHHWKWVYCRSASTPATVSVKTSIQFLKDQGTESIGSPLRRNRPSLPRYQPCCYYLYYSKKKRKNCFAFGIGRQQEVFWVECMLKDAVHYSSTTSTS
jgi:hypothetical protein